MRHISYEIPLSMTAIILVFVGCSRCHAFQATTSSLEKRPSCLIQEVSRNPTETTRHFSVRTQLCMIGGKNKKNLSASERERRDEENRRRSRKDEVVPGTTSAKPGEKDFELDPKATELEFLRQASNVQQEVYAYTDKGMELLKLVRKSRKIIASQPVMRHCWIYFWHSKAQYFSEFVLLLSFFDSLISCD